jgi:integrase
VRWVEEMTHKKSLQDDIGIIRALDPHLAEKRLDEIGQEVIDHIIQAMRQRGLSNGRINRVTALVRAILRKAEREWGWLDRAPSVRRLKEPAGKVRWLTHDEADRLLAELPEHLEAMARFTLATGLRAANITGLKWASVDLERRVAWVQADDAKGGKAIGVPLNREAVVVLRQQQGNHGEYVFTFRGRPCGMPNNTAWQSALQRAGIENFRWHDLRHTWASWHVQAGTPLNVLRELGGWSSYTMVLRYAHLAPEHLADYANRIAQPKIVEIIRRKA